MKIKQTILVIIFAFGQLLCWGQTEEPRKVMLINPTGAKKQPPYCVLQVDGKSLEFDPKKNEALDFDLIDPNSIESVTVLKGAEATQQYGDHANAGVIILSIKEFDLLPKELQSKFIEEEKK